MTTTEAFARFDSLSAATVEPCRGRWRGWGLPTGLALGGLIEALS